MDEILASIRRIIADEEPAKPAPPPVPEVEAAHPDADDVLDLAEVEPEPPPPPPPLDIEIPDLSFHESAPAEQAPPPVQLQPGPLPPPSPPPHPAAAPAWAPRPDALISSETTASVSHAFNLLSHTILTQNARTLEDLVGEMLKPMLKMWLDDNLPPLVERLVRAEIERVARGSR